MPSLELLFVLSFILNAILIIAVLVLLATRRK
jgi:hypothetical protein